MPWLRDRANETVARAWRGCRAASKHLAGRTVQGDRRPDKIENRSLAGDDGSEDFGQQTAGNFG